jgi:hypothetical protein
MSLFSSARRGREVVVFIAASGRIAAPDARLRVIKAKLVFRADCRASNAAAEFCGTKDLRQASREQVASFIKHIAEFAARDRGELLVKLNSFTQQAGTARNGASKRSVQRRKRAGKFPMEFSWRNSPSNLAQSLLFSVAWNLLLNRETVT